MALQHAVHMRDQNGHQWIEVSRHRTSEGPIMYRRCHCGLWQVTREPAAGHNVVMSARTENTG